jgi:hypothetical protein
MDYDYVEQLASQYPDNVVEKFARAFIRNSPYDGPGYCAVSYSRQFTVVNCIPDIQIAQPITAVVVLFLFVCILRMMCCRK